MTITMPLASACWAQRSSWSPAFGGCGGGNNGGTFGSGFTGEPFTFDKR